MTILFRMLWHAVSEEFYFTTGKDCATGCDDVIYFPCSEQKKRADNKLILR